MRRDGPRGARADAGGRPGAGGSIGAGARADASVERDLLVARTLDRVGALCGAGVPAERAWRLAVAREPALAAFLAADGTAGGLAALRSTDAGGSWIDVEALWSVAERTGAPAAPTLAAIARAVRDRAATRRAVRIALSGPRTSGRIVLALPLAGVLLGMLVGADTIGVLLTTPVGWGCVVAALTLVGIAQRWTGALVAAATPDDGMPGALAEAWAVALSGGGSWIVAERAVAEAFATVPSSPEEQAQLTATLDLARAAGVPAAGLLRALADDVRREAAARGLVDAERLAVRLVLPLGICVLPAFVAVGIVPVVVAILSSTVPEIV